MKSLPVLLLLGAVATLLGQERPGSAAGSATTSNPTASGPSSQALVERVADLLTDVSIGGIEDSRGRLSPPYLRLLEMRFDATDGLCRYIERGREKTDGRARAVAIQALAIIKDPRSIPWLERQLRDGLTADEGRTWLGEWFLGAFRVHEELAFLTGQEEWERFMLGLLRDESLQERWRRSPADVTPGWLVTILDRYFDSPAVIDAMREFEASAPDLVTLAAAQAGLLHHRKTIREDLLQDAIRKADAENELHDLARAAQFLPHELFVPYLARGLRAEGDTARATRCALRDIALCWDLETSDAWENWLAAHQGEGRAEWVRQANDRLLALARRQPAVARRILEEHPTWFMDPTLIPAWERLVSEKSLHEPLAVGLALGYHPCWRDDLARLAERACYPSEGGLSETAITCLREFGYVPGGTPLTWSDHIRRLGSGNVCNR